MKKCIIVVIAVLLIALGWTGYMFYFGEIKTIRSGAEYYGQWEEFDGYSGLDLFPRDIKTEQVKEYYFESQDIFEAPRAQMYALIKYEDKEDYGREMERLKELAIEHGNKEKKIMYNEDFF